jgi:hypothetical protein
VIRNILVRLAACLIATGATGATGANAQNQPAFTAAVDNTIALLPDVWQHEVLDAVGQTWSEETRACLDSVKPVVTNSVDPLSVRYETGRILISRGYIETMSQATLFTFMTMTGAFPADDLDNILDRHEATLAARRQQNIAFLRSGENKPPLFLDYGYATPYQSRLQHGIRQIGVPAAMRAADLLNGAVLVFALLHEAGHHVYRHCPDTLAPNPDPAPDLLHGETRADAFALQAFRNEGYPVLLALDAIRILHAYKVADPAPAFNGSLQQRLGRAVQYLEAPDYRVFTGDGGAPPAAARILANNLAMLLPLYQNRYLPRSPQ